MVIETVLHAVGMSCCSCHVSFYKWGLLFAGRKDEGNCKDQSKRREKEAGIWGY